MFTKLTEDEMEEFVEFIYGLADPRVTDPESEGIRYVGRTNNPNSRYYGHLSAKSGNVGKDAWIRELQELELEPVMVILERVAYKIPDSAKEERPGDRERYWMRYYWSKGAQLFNAPLKDRRTLPILPLPETSCSIAETSLIEAKRLVGKVIHGLRNGYDAEICAITLEQVTSLLEQSA
jgi:hypothetical protein